MQASHVAPPSFSSSSPFFLLYNFLLTASCLVPFRPIMRLKTPTADANYGFRPTSSLTCILVSLPTGQAASTPVAIDELVAWQHISVPRWPRIRTCLNLGRCECLLALFCSVTMRCYDSIPRLGQHCSAANRPPPAQVGTDLTLCVVGTVWDSGVRWYDYNPAHLKLSLLLFGLIPLQGSLASVACGAASLKRIRRGDACLSWNAHSGEAAKLTTKLGADCAITNIE